MIKLLTSCSAALIAATTAAVSADASPRRQNMDGDQFQCVAARTYICQEAHARCLKLKSPHACRTEQLACDKWVIDHCGTRNPNGR